VRVLASAKVEAAGKAVLLTFAVQEPFGVTDVPIVQEIEFSAFAGEVTSVTEDGGAHTWRPIESLTTNATLSLLSVE